VQYLIVEGIAVCSAGISINQAFKKRIRMSKKIFSAVILLVVLVRASFADSINISATAHRVMLNDTKIWIEDMNWNAVSLNGGPVELYLDETNPVFFSLVYNSLKDHMIRKKDTCYVFTVPVTAPGRAHAKICQIYFK